MRLTMRLLSSSDLLLAQYLGSHQATQSCLDAIARLLATSVPITRALLLSSEGRHGFYLDIGDPEPVFVRCGFTSGYEGEGPAGLAIALHLLRRFGVDVEEVVVPAKLLVRLDENCLTNPDMTLVLNASVVRPTQISDYQYDGLKYRAPPEDRMRAQFQHSVPWFAIDERLVDLALVLSRDPDKAVFDAFRRLESIVAKRAGLPAGTVGKNVFRKAFRGTGAHLTWPGLPMGEIEGRAQLFEAAFMAYRNPLAHREEGRGAICAYREFSVVNELFLLEAEAIQAEAYGERAVEGAEGSGSN